MYGKGKSKGQFHPIRDFKKLGFEENLLGAVKNFKEPTPIQASAWPIIASGRDTIGRSKFKLKISLLDGYYLMVSTPYVFPTPKVPSLKYHGLEIERKIVLDPV